MRVGAAFLAGFVLVASNPAIAEPKIINDPSRLDWQYYGAGYKLKPIRDASIPGGGAAVEVSVDRGDRPYSAGTNIPVEGFTKGKDYVVRFWAKTISSRGKGGTGEITVRFFRNADPYPGFGDKVVEIGPEWKAYEVHGRAYLSVGKDAGVGFQLAGRTQVLMLGQAVVAEGATTLEGGKVAVANDPLPPQIAGKGSLLNDPTNRNWISYGKALKVEPTVTDVYTRKGTRMTVATAGTNSWDAGVNVPVRDAIAKGDPLIVAVLARTRSADGKGTINLRVQSNREPYPGFGGQPIALAPNWRLYQWKIASEMDLPAGQGEIAIHAGTAAQDLEIGPVYVIRQAAAN